MTTQLSNHLTEEALDDALIGLGSAESEAHLAVCPACRARVEEFRSDMKVFNDTTLAWSEARPVPSLQGAARPKAHLPVFAPVGWALAAVVLLLLCVSVWNHDQRSASHEGFASVATPEDSETQIAQDNEMLRQVDVALNTGEASPISEYHLADGQHPRLKVRKELRNR
jgi:hypothetical protein